MSRRASNTMAPPATTTIAIAEPVSVSTIGIITLVYFEAVRWVIRLARAFASNSRKFTSSRASSWIARMPWTFSASAALTALLASRAAMNALVRKSVVWGKGVSVRVDHGGLSLIQKTRETQTQQQHRATQPRSQ